ncbi:hypothetical protein JB92DRAFT_2834689 [Gautieria morchelliformis]|nr:hypothetical protein JB92DRAFT_2834689 [Gautieria morchelliformis]
MPGIHDPSTTLLFDSNMQFVEVTHQGMDLNAILLIPWTAITKSPADYISPDALPLGIIFSNPSDMLSAHVQLLYMHILEHQDSSGSGTGSVPWYIVLKLPQEIEEANKDQFLSPPALILHVTYTGASLASAQTNEDTASPLPSMPKKRRKCNVKVVHSANEEEDAASPPPSALKKRRKHHIKAVHSASEEEDMASPPPSVPKKRRKCEVKEVNRTWEGQKKKKNSVKGAVAQE